MLFLWVHVDVPRRSYTRTYTRVVIQTYVRTRIHFYMFTNFRLYAGTYIETLRKAEWREQEIRTQVSSLSTRLLNTIQLVYYALLVFVWPIKLTCLRKRLTNEQYRFASNRFFLVLLLIFGRRARKKHFNMY